MQGLVDDIGAAVTALVTVEARPETVAVLAPALTTTVFLLAFGAQGPMAEAVLVKLAAVVEMAPEPVVLGPLELARCWVAAWVPGDAWAARRHGSLAVLHGERAHHTRNTRFAQVFVATSDWALGRLAEAEAGLRAVVEAAADDLIARTATIYLAMVLIDRGALGEARAMARYRLETGLANAQRRGALREAEGRWLLGEIAAKEGDLEAAERELAAAVPVLRPAALHWQLAATRLAAVRLARGAVPEALAAAGEVATALAASGGHGFRGTLVRLVHAEALHAAGEVSAAHAAIREARDDVQARAALVEDPSARGSFLEAVPENARVLSLAKEWLG
jgi:predicted negative regulator of RcsB-dependent stress response